MIRGADRRNADEMTAEIAVMDGNTAAAHIAYRVNEVRDLPDSRRPQ